MSFSVKNFGRRNNGHASCKTAYRRANRGGAFAGAVCGVFLDGRPVFTYVSGYADVEKKIPLKENAVFRLASMTKPVTAAAALLCEDRGLLHIEDKVSRYLPAFSHMKVGRMENGRPIEAGEASREITLYDVLTHSSGLGSGEVGAFPVRGAFPARYVGGGRRGLRGLASRFRPREQTVLQRGRRVRSRRPYRGDRVGYALRAVSGGKYFSSARHAGYGIYGR